MQVAVTTQYDPKSYIRLYYCIETYKIRSGKQTSKSIRETGSRIFQEVIISISYRKRQKVIRIQIKIKLKKRVEATKKKTENGRSQEKNNIEINIQEQRRTVYSERKMKAK